MVDFIACILCVHFRRCYQPYQCRSQTVPREFSRLPVSGTCAPSVSFLPKHTHTRTTINLCASDPLLYPPTNFRMLVGIGAQQWAKQHCFPICDPDELITGKHAMN